MGVPSSAASYAAGQDLAPAALRSAGLPEQLAGSGLPGPHWAISRRARSPLTSTLTSLTSSMPRWRKILTAATPGPPSTRPSRPSSWPREIRGYEHCRSQNSTQPDAPATLTRFRALSALSPAYSPSRSIRFAGHRQTAAALGGDCTQIAELGAPYAQGYGTALVAQIGGDARPAESSCRSRSVRRSVSPRSCRPTLSARPSQSRPCRGGIAHCAASTSITGSGWGKRPGVSDDDVAARAALHDLVRDGYDATPWPACATTARPPVPPRGRQPLCRVGRRAGRVSSAESRPR